MRITRKGPKKARLFFGPMNSTEIRGRIFHRAKRLDRFVIVTVSNTIPEKWEILMKSKNVSYINI